MRARSKPRSFVSAVVVTVAAGCGASGGPGGGGNECCYNPPPILSFQGLEPGDRVTRHSNGNCSQYHASTGVGSDVTCPSSLTSPGVIWRNGDQCQTMPEIQCPPPSEATCNPPPPMPVPCPTE